MTRPYSRVTRNPAALLLSSRGAVQLVVVGLGLGVLALQHVQRMGGWQRDGDNGMASAGTGAPWGDGLTDP